MRWKSLSLYVLPPVSQKFHQRCLWNGSNVSLYSLIDDGPLLSFHGRSSSASSFHASLFQAIRDGMMSLALCPQVVSQAFQHSRSSEKQATCGSCFACQSICSVISLHSGMSTGVFEGGCWPSTHSGLAASHSTFQQSFQFGSVLPKTAWIILCETSPDPIWFWIAVSGCDQTDPAQKQAGVQESSGPVLAKRNRPATSFQHLIPFCFSKNGADHIVQNRPGSHTHTHTHCDTDTDGDYRLFVKFYICLNKLQHFVVGTAVQYVPCAFPEHRGRFCEQSFFISFKLYRRKHRGKKIFLEVTEILNK